MDDVSDTPATEPPSAVVAVESSTLAVEVDPSGLSRPKALILAALLALVCSLPIVCTGRRFFGSYVFVRSPTDYFALATFLPAVAAAAYVTRTTSRRIGALSLWGRFVFGWLVLLPVVAVVAFSRTVIYMIIDSDVDWALWYAIPMPGTWAATAFACVPAAELAFARVAIPHVNVNSPRRFVLYSVFTTLGLGTGEAYYYVLYSQRVTPPAEQVAHLIRMLLSFIVILIPMQVLCTYHIGLGIAYRSLIEPCRRRLSSCIILPFIARWAFLFVVLGLPMLTGMQWVGLNAMVLMPIYVLAVRRDELRMPQAFLKQAGSIIAFECGALADDANSAVLDFQLETGDHGQPASRAEDDSTTLHRV